MIDINSSKNENQTWCQQVIFNKESLMKVILSLKVV